MHGSKTKPLDEALTELARVMRAHRRTMEAAAVEAEAARTRTALPPLDRLLAGVERHFGLLTSDTLRAKLAAALRSTAGDDLTVWLDRLGRAGADHPDWLALVECLTVHETYLFRDWGQLELLRDVLAGAIADGAPRRELRLWSAGCASGEEAVSLAVMSLEALIAAGIARETAAAVTLPADWRVEILGTDLSRLTLAQARTGIYETGRLSSFRAVPASLLRYFPAADPPGNRRVRDDVRSLVRFAHFNLLGEHPPSLSPAAGFDVVSCRNVLIYFADEPRARVRRMLERAVRPGGLLLLGPTDPRPPSRDFAPIRSGPCSLYRRRG